LLGRSWTTREKPKEKRKKLRRGGRMGEVKNTEASRVFSKYEREIG
jgi:hypothetical protein